MHSIKTPGRSSEAARSTIQKRDAKGVIRHGAEWLTIWSDPESLRSDAERLAESETKRRLAAAARAISRDPSLNVTASIRGEADSQALVRRFHSAEIHARFAPPDPSERRLFDLCEQVRCEAAGARLYPGVAENLEARQIERVELNVHLASLVPLPEALRMVLRDALIERAEPSIPSVGFRLWDRWIRDGFGDLLDSLRRAVYDQAVFAPLSLELIRGLGTSDAQARRFTPSEDAGNEAAPERQREDPSGEIFEPGGDLLPQPASLHTEPVPAAPYTVFTTVHDRVVRAADLPRAPLPALDQKRALASLVNRLQRRLLARQARDWTFDLEEGLIDAARLDRVIVNPGFASAYKQERQSEFRDSAVTILIDNSGSMRGKPIEIACVASDLISSALERCHVTCEILGFTTAAWKGGESYKDWVRAGRPANPGRLNDLVHIIYKSADEPVRRARGNLSAMLEPGLLKENVDGEALLWAARRLLARREERKVLIVISDGAPVDQATLENNADLGILDRHLRQVIAEIENSGAIQLAAIGVKHDVDRYYRNCVRIADVESLGNSLVAMIDTLLR